MAIDDTRQGMRSAFSLNREAYMVSAALADNGGTFVPLTGKRADHLTNGYMIGGAMPEYVFTLPMTERDSQENALRIILRNMRQLSEEGRVETDYLYIGAWLPGDGTIVWEVSEHLLSLPDSLALAAGRGEYSIWDVRNNHEIVADAHYWSEDDADV